MSRHTRVRVGLISRFVRQAADLGDAQVDVPAAFGPAIDRLRPEELRQRPDHSIVLGLQWGVLFPH